MSYPLRDFIGPYLPLEVGKSKLEKKLFHITIYLAPGTDDFHKTSNRYSLSKTSLSNKCSHYFQEALKKWLSTVGK